MSNDTVRLVTLSSSESHLGKRRHLALAISSAGDVVGAVLTSRGTTVCTLFGFLDGRSGCLTLSGCGFDNRTACS